MPHRQPLSDRQLEVLRWVAQGCPHGDWPDESHKNSARALESRGLVRVRRTGKLWHAAVTADGQYYLDHLRYPDPPPLLEPRSAQRPASPSRIQSEAALITARKAIRQATTSQERRALGTARGRAVKRAAHRSLLRDMPMRYKIVVSRVQTAERHVRAASEEDAIRKVQEELERPYGFLGGWTTAGTDMDIVTVESPLGDSVPPQASQDGALLLSVKAASKFLGLSAAVLYELINRGEIAHVMIGSRRYISRDQISTFIEASTYTGYHQRR